MTNQTRPIESPGALPMPPGLIEGPSAWYGRDLQRTPRLWTFELSQAELDEIERAIAAVSGKVALSDISPRTFPLPTLATRLRDIRDNTLLNGIGFCVIRGFQVSRHSTEENAIAYLGVGSHFGNFRSQNAAGHLLGHVRDLGRDIRDQNTRYYQTNKQLEYHTDSCDVVGLLCLKTSRSGGESRIVSSVTLYNEVLKRRPDLLPALFHAYPTDRRGEVPPGMKPWFDVPVFNWYEGRLTTIYVGQYIRSAQQFFPEARRLTATELEALEFLDGLTNEPGLNLQMEFLPGDMQFVHNHQVLHSRTDFEDWPELERKRHLFRLWLAPPDARPLPPSFAPRYGSVEPGARGGIVTANTTLKFVLNPE